MAVKDRLHRSELAVPGSNKRMLEKAPGAGADIVFLDLEDAVAPDDKEQARANIIEALNAYDWSKCAVSIRMNGLDTHYAYRDLVEIVEACGDKLDTILIPKVGIRRGRLLRRHHAVADRGLQGLQAHQHPRADRDGLGHGQRRGNRPELPGAHGSHGVRRCRLRRFRPRPHHPDRRRQSGLRHADRCRTTAAIAPFTGATNGISASPAWSPPAGPMACGPSTARSATSTIPTAFAPPRAVPPPWAARANGRSIPSQVALANEMFTPTEKEVTRAYRILEAMAQAAKEGKGAVSLDGRLIDAASIRMAENVVTPESRQIEAQGRMSSGRAG